jgi:hypothetical protein
MAWTAKQYEHQVLLNDSEIEDLNNKLRQLPADSPQRARLQKRLDLVTVAQAVWRKQYFKLTGVRLGGTTVEHVRPERTVGDLLADALPIDGDPAQHPNYIQNVTRSVGIPIWGGNFWLYHKRVPSTALDADSVQMARGEPRPGDDPISGSPALAHVYRTRAAADAALAAFGVPGAYTYYVGPGGHFYPTVLSATSAPVLCAALSNMLVLERSDAQAAGKLSWELGWWYVGARNPLKVAKPAGAAEITAEAWRRQAKILADGLRASGKSVTLDLAGGGEVADAINVNLAIDQQVKDIPNLIKRGAEEIGTIFEEGSVDKIVSNNVVAGQVNWAATAKGAFTVLKSGGKVSIAPYAGDLAAHVAEITQALKDARFVDVTVTLGSHVTAIKP